MSKNKYRLTKIKRNDRIVNKSIVDGQVVFNYEKNCSNKQFDIKDDYINPIQINGRMKSYLRHKDKNGVKEERINRVKNNMQNETRYINQYIKSVPLSISYYENEKKREIYDRKKELIENNKEKYLKIIEEIYVNLIDESLLSLEVNSNNYLIQKIRENRDNFLKSVEFENEFDLHFHYHMVKKVFKRLTWIIRKKVVYKAKSINRKKVVSKIKVNDLIKKVRELDCRNIQEYLMNQFIMNTIDINKNKEKALNSIDLEIKRQEDIFYKKIVNSITQFQQRLVSEHALTYSKKCSVSIDPIGQNMGKKTNEESGNGAGNNYQKKISDEIKSKFFAGSKEVEKLYIEKLSETWNVSVNDACCNKNQIVELRSRAIHADDRVKLSQGIEEIRCEELFLENQSNYIKAIQEKYISNNVNKYFEEKDIENIVKQSIDNEFEFIAINYMPRFSKIIKRNKYIHEKEQGFNYWEYPDDMCNDSINFLLKEIYNNNFRKMINNEKVSIEIMQEVLHKYKEINPNLTTILGLDADNMHSDEYALISREVIKGNYEEVMVIWEIYMLESFMKYLRENNYMFIFESNIPHERVYNFEYSKEEIKYSDYEEVSKLFYILSKGLNRRELNELMNSFKSFTQFLIAKGITDNNIMDIDTLKQTYNLLNLSLELLNRKVNPLSKNQNHELSLENKSILEIILENNKDISFYEQGNDKFIEYKFFNFIKEDNIHLIYNKLFGNIIKESYIINYEENIKQLENQQKDVSEHLQKLKVKIKTDKKKNYKVNQPSNDLVKKYNDNLCKNFEINTVRFYTLYKLSNFINEIFSTYVRLIKAVESDFMMILGKEEKEFSKNDQEKLKKIIDKNSVKKYFDIRNEIAHYNYYNSLNCEKSLRDYYEILFNVLKYNYKRKKALRTSVEYIFSKYCIELRRVKGEFRYLPMTHRFSKKRGAKKTNWNELKLICNNEIKLFKDVFEKNIQNNDK